jgi:hypothetical protein
VVNVVRRGNTPFFSSRLDMEYLSKLDRLAEWLHKTRGFRLSRRVAIEFLIDHYWYGEDFEVKDSA